MLTIFKQTTEKELKKIERKKIQLLLAINPQSPTGIFTTIRKQEA